MNKRCFVIIFDEMNIYLSVVMYYKNVIVFDNKTN